MSETLVRYNLLSSSSPSEIYLRPRFIASMNFTVYITPRDCLDCLIELLQVWFLKSSFNHFWYFATLMLFNHCKRLLHKNCIKCDTVLPYKYVLQTFFRELGWVSSANVRDSSPIQPSFIIKSFVYHTVIPF